MSEKHKLFPSDFISIINFSPFDFSREERESFIEALESALRKVPVSDFHGVYRPDFRHTLMGVQSGLPFSVDLEDDYDEVDIEIFLDAVDRYKDTFHKIFHGPTFRDF